MGNRIFDYYKSIISIFKIKKIVLLSLIIIFILLIFDHYNVIQIMFKYANLPIIVTGVLTICVFLNINHIYSLSKLNIVNYFDYWITVIFCAIFIFGILFIFSDGFLSYKEAVLFIIWIIFYAFIVSFRIYLINKKTKKIVL